MQQGFCDMYGVSVDKGMLVRMNSDIEEPPLELMHHGISGQGMSPPSLLDAQQCSGDEDGNSSENQNRSPPTSCENSIIEEPKAKKRRKQSNPSRYQTAPVIPLLDSEDCGTMTEEPKSDEALDLHTDPPPQPHEGTKIETETTKYRCHHCNSLFETEDLLRIHVEEEHVQKILERQLQQQQSYNKATSGNTNQGTSYEPSKDHPRTSEGLGQSDQATNSSSESLIQENREYKNPHFPFPPIPPPFIPFTRTEDMKTGNLTVPLSMFPNPMAPFLFPVIPQGQTPPVSNGSSHSSQGVRIFNLEAYCELCNKEFCNKYFLKTHKANKHGIYSSDTMMSTPYGAPFLSPGLTSPIPLPHLLQPPTSESLPPGRTGVINMESYCEICQKEFCNKYFLKKHKQKIHGIGDPGQNVSPSTTPSVEAKSHSPVVATAGAALTTPAGTAAVGVHDKGGAFHDEGREVLISHTESNPALSLQNHKAGPTSVATVVCSAPSSGAMISPIAVSTDIQSPGSHHGSTSDATVSHVFTPEKLREMGVINADAFCELCCKEFCNKYFLRTHKQNKHGISMPEVSPGKSQGSGGSGSHSQSSTSSSHNQTSDKLENMAAMNEMYPSEKNVQGSPGSLGFEGFSGDLSCEFCNRPFSSLYLLKMHKFYSHNIPYVKEESKSKPASPSDECHQGENKDSDLMKPLMPLPPQPMTENVSTSLQEDVASQDLQKLQSMIRELNASASSENSKIACNLCRLEFDNKYFLRAHMMNEHGVLPNEDGHVPGHGSTTSNNNNNSGNGEMKASEGIAELSKLGFGSSGDSEAYCEICQKEFCSKYFLKTHKQNIHGIPLDMSSSQKKPNMAEEVSQIKTIVSNTLSTSLAASSASASHTFASGSPTVTQPVPAPGASTTSASTTQTSISQISVASCQNSSECSYPSALTSHPPASSLGFSTSVIPFPTDVLPNACNATLTPTITHTSSVLFPSNLQHPPALQMPTVAHTASGMHASQAVLASNLPSAAHLPAIQPPANHPLSSLEKPRNLTGRNYCNICNKELCNKYFMKTHMLKMHGINLDSQPHEAARISTIGGVQCDICQKELCSKYFLKVHKQNTHGIFEEPAQPKDSNRETSSTSSSSAPAEKDASGLGLDLTDSGGRYFSQYPEVCPICNCRFKSIKWLKAHMVSDHGNMLKENVSHGSVLNADSGNTGVDSSCICVLCGQGFGDKVALHVHLIKDHQSPTEELGAANNSGNKTPSADSSALVVPEQARMNGSASPGCSTAPAGHSRPHPKSHSIGGSRIYHCSFCVYSTRWLSNLYAHEKRHTGVNTEGEKKFVCRVCHRAYRYNHSLQRHFLSHRAAGLSLKDLTHPVAAGPHHSQHLAQNISRPWSSHHKADSVLEKNPGLPHKIKRYRCSKCSRKFRTRELCLSHIHVVHSNKRAGGGSLVLQKSLKPFRCRFCGFATRAWNVLKIHINKQHHNDLDSPVLDEDADEKPSGVGSGNATQESPKPGSAAATASSSSSGGSYIPSLPPPPPNSPHLPMTFAMPQNPPSAGSFIMQPFLLAQPECDGASRNGTFVPSLVYLPVSQKVSQPMTVAFSLTPA